MKGVLGWVRAHPFLAGALAVAVLLLAFLGASLMRTPRNDRAWAEYFRRPAHVEMRPGSFLVAPVSDWSYAPGRVTDRAYGAFNAKLDDLRSVWLMVEPSPASDIVAHTLLLFEFADARIVGVTIEARMEEGERYSPFAGLWNRYELAYVWATPRDLLVRRAVFLGHKVFVYPLRLADGQMHSLLRKLLGTTADLEGYPRFYNTLFSNCTNELAKRADLPWDLAFVLTGLAPSHLFRRGLIPGKSFKEAKARADMTDWLKGMAESDRATFDLALLAELDRRSGASGSAQ